MHSAELKKSFARQPSQISADQHGQKPLRLILSLISLETRERAARGDEGGSSCLRSTMLVSRTARLSPPKCSGFLAFYSHLASCSTEII